MTTLANAPDTRDQPCSRRPSDHERAAAGPHADVLTDLLTATMDDLGCRWNEELSEQGRSGLLDGAGRP